MKFTRYFSRVLKDHGTPDIQVSHYQTLLNIIVLENKIDLLKKMQSRVRNSDRKYFLSADISGLQSQLNQLTMENKPEHLLKYMLNQSRFEN